MPLYEYLCSKDGVFELMRKFSDPPLSACPTCGGPVEKLLSAPAIQFKGSGWYITDYARKSAGESGKDKDSGKDKAGTESSAKSTDSSSSKDSSSSSGAASSSTPSSTTTSSSDKK